MKELQRKRHLATPDVSFRGRVRKVAKWQTTRDDKSDEESESKSIDSWILCIYLLNNIFHLIINLDIPNSSFKIKYSIISFINVLFMFYGSSVLNYVGFSFYTFWNLPHLHFHLTCL